MAADALRRPSAKEEKSAAPGALAERIGAHGMGAQGPADGQQPGQLQPNPAPKANIDAHLTISVEPGATVHLPCASTGVAAQMTDDGDLVLVIDERVVVILNYRWAADSGEVSLVCENGDRIDIQAALGEDYSGRAAATGAGSGGGEGEGGGRHPVGSAGAAMLALSRQALNAAGKIAHRLAGAASNGITKGNGIDEYVIFVR